jgi:hypothetical protein
MDGSRNDKKDLHGKGTKQDDKVKEKIDGKGDEEKNDGSKEEFGGSKPSKQQRGVKETRDDAEEQAKGIEATKALRGEGSPRREGDERRFVPTRIKAGRPSRMTQLEAAGKDK